MSKATKPHFSGPIAILGGVFNPIHIGHLRVAQEALRALPVEQVIFLPSGTPPHKQPADLLSVKHRVEMLRIALKPFSKFNLDERELHRPGLSYTVDSLREFKAELASQKNSKDQIFFLIGADNVGKIGKWHKAKEIIDLCTPVTIPRDSELRKFSKQDLPWLNESELNRLNQFQLNCEEFKASSSEIRLALSRGQNPHELLPPAVFEYIQQHNLYR